MNMRAGMRSIGVGVFSGIALLSATAAVSAQAQESGPRFYNSPAVAAMKPPLSQAVRVGDILFMSGAIGIVPGTPDLAPGGIEGETKQAMDNIGAVLKANDLSFDNVVKCTVMLADMAKWGDFNKVYVTYFKPGRLPARSAFGASGLARNAQVEVECLAYAGK
jgi:2-iminobutanoate/2-iminopropanoate deaminase